MRKPLGANRERGVWGGEGTVAPPRDFLEEPAAQFPPNHLLATRPAQFPPRDV
ncbi:MAG: hypothetical protein HYW48_08640 [Deltaproteobacteria bacterium]|nr:hypothetical protein [Deltaproteobacteria bacterium]